jgi:predicted nucleic acid-binding protein
METLRIYLDICSYNRPFDSQSQIKVRLETEAKLYIQTGIREKKYTLIWSYMLDYENENSPYEEKKKAITPWREIADSYCPSSDDILSTGQKIMGYGIKAKDSLHIACAIKSSCAYFITTDNSLTNKTIPNIKVINPIDFLRETEDSR